MALPIDASGPMAAVDRAAPGAADICAQLDRILADPTLQASPRRRALLRFLVEESLAGRADRLKGFTVALAVFGRDETFDQQADPVVRLEARRLRRDLDSYYVAAGSHDPVRISIPKGGYAPHFEWRQIDVAPEAPPLEGAGSGGAAAADVTGDVSEPAIGAGGGPRATRLIAAVAGIAILLAAAAAWHWFGSHSPFGTADARGAAVIVLPFEPLSAGEGDRFLASGVTQEIITDLMRFSGLRLYSLPASFGQDGGADPVDLGQDLGVAYVVKGGVRSDGGSVRVGAQLFDARTGRVLWSETYDRALTPGAVLAVQSELAASIASVLGQPYGIVNNDVTARLSGGAMPSMPSYACVLRAYAYRRTFATALHAPVLGCLAAAVRRDPDYAEAWAMLGWLHLDAARFGYVSGADAERAFEQALGAASHAVALDGASVPALQALASIHHYLGHFAESERIQRQALALNPNDPDTLAQLGWRLAVRGNWDEGIPYLERAIARTVSPPGWYFDLITVHLYLEGKYPEMLAAAERSAAAGDGIGWSFVAIAQGALGNPDAARQALARMAALSPLLARDPAAAYRQHKPIESIVDALVAGLRKAGWTAPSAPAARRG
jgi:TolB-like protein